MTRAAVLLAAALPASAAYTYYQTDNLTSINTTYWWQNGSLTAGPSGLSSAEAVGGSLISKVAVPDGTSEYEVKTILNLTYYLGGTFIHYLRATSDALNGPTTTGTFYAVELQNPFFNGGTCTATIAIYKRVSGVTTLLASTPVTCRNGMVLRSIRMADRIHVMIDGWYVTGAVDNSIATGKPGVGVRAAPAGNTIQPVQNGPLDRVPPNPVLATSVATSVNSNRVDFQWQGAADDANGIGVWHYRVIRNGVYLGEAATPEFTDATPAPGTTYTYSIYVVDDHFTGASAPTVLTVQTAPPGHLDARRIGVRPTGAYWGAAGEQIDTSSGNVNFTLPLLRAQGRGGTGATFALNCNSQNWRLDNGVHWKLGRDVGYGFGWKLLAGSITPYWSNLFTVHHYLFTDSTGAEYRLDLNQSGIWTATRDSLHIWYDPATYKLYFPDGAFWYMGAASGGTEQDGGTRYPTMIQDSNGNQLS